MVTVRQKRRKRTIGRLDRTVVQDSMTPARLAHDTLVSAPRYDSLLTVVLSENKVKQQTQTWRQQQDNYPGNGFQGIAILGNNDQYQPNSRNEVQ